MKKPLNFLKLVLLFATFGFIFYKIFYAYHLEDLVAQTSSFSFGAGKTLLFTSAFVLMCLNWMIEAFKWRLLINRYEYVSYAAAIRAVTSGVALSIITPNQVGDFAGRVIHLRHFSKIKGALVTVIGHTAQMIMTAAFGLLAMIWLFHDQGRISHALAGWSYGLLVLAVALTILAYLNIGILSRLRISERINDYISVFRMYTRIELVKVLLFALMRYCIFVAQYLILLHFFNVRIGTEAALICIISTLCAQSFVPSFILIELGMRGASALWFFSMYTGDIAGVLLSAYTLWMINLMLPGLAGLAVIMRWRFRK